MRGSAPLFFFNRHCFGGACDARGCAERQVWLSRGQHLGQMAFDGDLGWRSFWGGVNRDPADQLASGCKSMRIVARSQAFAQPGEGLSVGYAEVRHDTDGRWPGLSDRHTQPFRLRFCSSQFGREAGAAEPVGDGVQQVLQLSLRRIQLLLEMGAHLPLLGSQPVPLGGIGLGKRLQQDGVHHVLGEHRQNAFFQEVPRHRPAMIAGPPRDVIAGVATSGVCREISTTGATEDLAGQQVTRSTPFPKAGDTGLSVLGCGSLGQALLHPIPKLVFDQTKPRRLARDALFSGVQSAVMLTGLRVDDAVTAVPADFAEIGAVAQNAIGVAGPSSQGHRIPAGASRGRNPFGVQAARDHPGRDTCGVLLKDPPHDRGLLWNNFPQAPVDLPIGAKDAGDTAIAIRRRPGGSPGPDAAFQPTASLCRKILQIERIHRAFETDMEQADLALTEGHEPHALVCGDFIEGRDMLLVTRETVQCLGQDHIDLATPHRSQEGLIALPQHGAAGDRRVLEGQNNLPAVLLGLGTANAKLVLDGVFRLPIAGVARVECHSGRLPSAGRRHRRWLHHGDHSFLRPARGSCHSPVTRRLAAAFRWASSSAS